MTAAPWALTRAEPRAQVLPIEVKGLLSKGSQLSPFFVWDISVSGIGIILSDEFKEGDHVTLTFSNPNFSVNCRVQWCAYQEPDYDFQEASYRLGLKINETPEISFQGLVDHINRLR